MFFASPPLLQVHTDCTHLNSIVQREVNNTHPGPTTPNTQTPGSRGVDTHLIPQLLPSQIITSGLDPSLRLGPLGLCDKPKIF